MGFKKRMRVILRSRFNDWLTRAEDPAQILAQAPLREQQRAWQRDRSHFSRTPAVVSSRKA